MVTYAAAARAMRGMITKMLSSNFMTAAGNIMGHFNVLVRLYNYCGDISASPHRGLPIIDQSDDLTRIQAGNQKDQVVI